MRCDGWVNDVEDETLNSEDTNEDGCFTEDRDDTLQPEYFGSDAGTMNSPARLCEVFSEPGWTLVTRKTRCTVLGSVWDVDSDMILGHVADDVPRKEW